MGGSGGSECDECVSGGSGCKEYVSGGSGCMNGWSE